MKNIKLFITVVAISLALVSCKGSKCDCPSFKPKSQVEKPVLHQVSIKVVSEVA